VTFRCGCDPRAGRICGSHCQMQGCEYDDEWSGSWAPPRHTDACIRGERIEETPEQVRARLLPEAF
jgi:hypothetical protein